VPALESLFEVRSLRPAPEPFIEFDRHRRKEMPFVDSVEQMFAEGATSGIAGRPDLDSRHDSADGGDNLRRNTLGLFRARLGFFEAGVKLAQGLFRGSLSLATASGDLVRSPILSLLGSCHIEILAEAATHGKITAAEPTAKGKGQSDFSDWPLLMPATTYAPTHLARAVPSALRGLTSVFGMGTGGSPAVRSPTSRSCQLSAPSPNGSGQATYSSQLLAEADVLC
jgi:hypothetical protein